MDTTPATACYPLNASAPKMLNPTFANRLSWLYAVGNTPATSLTRNVPIGSDVDVLSLGCGDVRNILYTSYTEASSGMTLARDSNALQSVLATHICGDSAQN